MKNICQSDLQTVNEKKIAHTISRRVYGTHIQILSYSSEWHVCVRSIMYIQTNLPNYKEERRETTCYVMLFVYVSVEREKRFNLFSKNRIRFDFDRCFM